MTADPARPPIPVALAHRPTMGGVVVPWVNVRLGDGGVDFRRAHRRRWEAAWKNSLCQMCGRPLRHPTCLVGGPGELDEWLFDEPPLHPECMLYASKACPMLAGRQPFYRTGPTLSEGHRGATCYLPGCECAGWKPSSRADSDSRAGKPAHLWYALYVADYATAVWPDGNRPGLMKVTGGRPQGDPLRVRLISVPGDGRVWQTSNMQQLKEMCGEHGQGQT